MTVRSYEERIPQWTLGDRLRKARMLTGMTTRDFAAEIGVSQKTVNNAESDAHDVRKIVINAWSLATGVPVEWLQNGDTPGPTDPGVDEEVRHQGLEPRTRWFAASSALGSAA